MGELRLLHPISSNLKQPKLPVSAEEILELLRQQHNWAFQPIAFFGQPALRTYANGRRLTVFPLNADQLQTIAATDTTPIAWDFVRGQIGLAIAGQLTDEHFEQCWTWLRGTNLSDIWLDPAMQALAFRSASQSLRQAGVSPQDILRDYFGPNDVSAQ